MRNVCQQYDLAKVTSGVGCGGAGRREVEHQEKDLVWEAVDRSPLLFAVNPSIATSGEVLGDEPRRDREFIARFPDMWEPNQAPCLDGMR